MKKKLLTAIYFVFSLVLVTGEPQTKSTTLYFGFYLLAIANLWVSIFFVNKQFKNNNTKNSHSYESYT